MATYEITTDKGTYQVDTEEGPSKLESFGRAAVNNLPLGGQIGALGTGLMSDTNQDYSSSLAEWNQKAAEAKKANPISYGAGAVAGSVAPALIPGVGEAMAAAPVATGAALGAANAVGNTDIAQKPMEALKQAGEGAAIGGVLGKVLPSGEKAAEGLEGYANRKAVEASGLPPGLLNQSKEDIEKLGSTMHDLGLTSGSMDDKINMAQAHLKDVGSKIGQLGANIPPVADVTPYTDKLQNLMKESSAIFEQGSNAEAGAYRQAIANFQQPNLTFDALQNLKSTVGDRAFDSLGNVKNDALANVYGVYKDAMKDIVSASPQEYQSLMDRYGDLLDINKALGKLRGSKNAGGAPAKGFGMMGKIGAMVTGGNVPATLGLAGALAPAHPFMAVGALTGITQNPGAMSAAARGLSEAAPIVGAGLKLGSIDSVTSHLLNTISTAPQKLGRFAKPLMQAAQTGGTRGLAAQHFLLSSQYPEYNELIMHGVHKGSEEMIHGALKGDTNAD